MILPQDCMLALLWHVTGDILRFFLCGVVNSLRRRTHIFFLIIELLIIFLSVCDLDRPYLDCSTSLLPEEVSTSVCGLFCIPLGVVMASRLYFLQ